MNKTENQTAKVDEFLEKLDHPFKAEVQAIRAIIKGVNTHITEQIKWNAPSFSYQGAYLGTFHLHAKSHVHLVFHNPMIAQVKSGLLEGDYKDRRMAYFSDLHDVSVKEAELENVVKALVRLID
jgi:uncharacterized protein YdhG (YjbR/CyaY superfamily)